MPYMATSCTCLSWDYALATSHFDGVDYYPTAATTPFNEDESSGD